MALTATSDQITNRYTRPQPTPHSAGEVHVTQFEVAVLATLAINNLVGLAVIPPDCIPVGIEIFPAALDDGSAIVLDVGILNTDADDLVASSLLIDGSTAAQTGVVARMDDYECAFEPATWLDETDSPGISEDKIVAAKVMTAATTGAAGTIRGQVFYRAAINGI